MNKLQKYAIAALSSIILPVFAHQEPDFSKLPDVQKISREAVVSTIFGIEVGRKNLSHGTTFKIAQKFGKHYYATANHLGSRDLPNPAIISNMVYDEWYVNDQKMTVEARDKENDVMILSTTYDLGDESIKICKTPPKLGENSFVYGYHRGYLGLGEGRIGNLESKIMESDKTYYLSDTDAIAGASGSPSSLYRDGDFCVYGMLLGNVDGGFFSVSSDIKYTFELYNKIVTSE